MNIKQILACACMISGLFGSVAVAEESLPLPVRAVVSIADQRVWVYVGSQLTYTWDVSTSSPDNKDCTEGGVPGARAVDCVTPTGLFVITRVSLMAHAAAKWDNAPMPHAVFFDHQGDAFHATDGAAESSRLGQQASHGCVRLSPEHAAIWYELVEQHRRGNNWPGVVIKIQNAHFMSWDL